MIVSLNRGTPTETPKYYNPYYGTLQKGTHDFGKPHIGKQGKAEQTERENAASSFLRRLYRCDSAKEWRRPFETHPDWLRALDLWRCSIQVFFSMTKASTLDRSCLGWDL